MNSDPPEQASDPRDLAQARERFLQVDPLDPLDPLGVRASIVASWWRSRQSNVAADRLEWRYDRNPNLDTPLTRSAEPVLRRLRDQLEDQSLAIVLTDAAGVVLSRLTADASLERHLDRVQLAVGFSYAEHLVGTNGIGTALEAGKPMHVFGHEHYADNLEALACAGVPIRHPLSGKTVGAIDLTCWSRDAGPLLVTLAKTTAEQIRQALLTETGVREIELLHAYLRSCSHSSGMVFALNNDVVMMNDRARTLLGEGDQSALLRHAAEALAESRDPVSFSLELPSGMQVRLHLRPVHADGRVAGGVVDVKVVETRSKAYVTGHSPTAMLLPGLIGSGPLWRRACVELEDVYATGGWLVVEGEPGVGKTTALRALHQRTNASGRCRVLDAADAVSDPGWRAMARLAISEEHSTVLLRHFEDLPDPVLRTLTADLQQAQSRGAAWVAVTTPPTAPRPELARLLQLFPHTVVVPPLRHHVEDIDQLVPFLLLRLGQGSRLTCAPETMQLLARFTWPGNVSQLVETLRHVLRHRRTGVLVPGDLPPEIQALSRRRLRALESMERDAIVLGLLDAAGNKALAARALGMSRATIYRKIHEYGIG